MIRNSDRLHASLVLLAAAVIAALALATLAGWSIRSPLLVQLRPQWAPMQFTTALCLLALAVGMCFPNRLPGVAVFCGLSVAVVSGVTIATYVIGAPSVLDQSLVEPLSTDVSRYPGRMSPNTALALLMSAAALTLLGLPKVRVRMSPAAVSLGLGCALLGLVSLSAYLSGEAAITGWLQFPGMALTTSFALTLAGAALALEAWRHASTGTDPIRNLAPSAIALILLVVSFNLWQALTEQSLSHLQAETSQVRERTQIVITDRVKGQMNLMERMARRWSAHAPYRGQLGWTEDAEMLLAHSPFIDGVGLTDKDWTYQYASFRHGAPNVVGTRADRDELRRQAFEAAVRRNEVRLTPATELIQGGSGFVIVAPLRDGEETKGLALAGIHFSALLNPVTGGYPAGFAFSVAQGGHEVYRSQQADGGGTPRFAQSVDLELPGATWHILVWPTTAYIEAATGSLPLLVLLFGVVTALLTWTTLWIAQISANKNRALSQMTHILESQVAERRRAEAEIRLLNAELENRVQQRTRELEATNEELESFSYSVSHDLRAPLASIAGFSKMLADTRGKDLGPEGMHYVQRIGSNVTRMGQIIDDLLDLARVSRSELMLRDIDLSVVARNAMTRLLEREPGRRVEFRVADELRARADPNLMTIVLENLLSNALKFTGERDLAVIEVGRQMREGRRIIFVRDNGVGFDMAFAGKLFGVFQRLHSSSEFPGNGIGLATVKRVIARHFGEIWASGEPGKGAVFFFWLPD